MSGSDEAVDGPASGKAGSAPGQPRLFRSTPPADPGASASPHPNAGSDAASSGRNAAVTPPQIGVGGGANAGSDMAKSGNVQPGAPPRNGPNPQHQAEAKPGPGPQKGPQQGPNQGPNGGPGPALQRNPAEAKQKPPCKPKLHANNNAGAAKPQAPVRPPAPPARLRRHHRSGIWAFAIVVILPLLVTVGYLFGVARDQYASVTAFTVRQEESGNASDLLGGLELFTGAGGSSDTDILFEYIQSQELADILDARLNLRGHYQQHWDTDKVFSLWPEATKEDLVWFWKRVVRISYDQGAGLMEVQVRAFDPGYAQAVAREVVTESERMINALSETARDEATRFAQADLDEALEQLKSAREALTAFRTQTQIVDPEVDIQGRMGVMNNLQQQLAEALIEADLLTQTSSASDPRVAQARRRIEVIRDRIASERQAFAQGADDVGALAEDYPSLIAEFERLTVDREYAEESYRAALTALDVARANAIRRSRYLATFIQPTLADSAAYPQRYALSGLAALFLTLTWAILALVYYSIRDRR